LVCANLRRIDGFPALARALTDAGTRRGQLAFLATLPVLGGLFALLDPDEADAKGRRKRRTKSHKHGMGNGRHRTGKRTGKAHAKATVCAGKCGNVKNNCKKTIDCGSCDCDPTCGECFLRQEQGPITPGQCVPDPEQVGDPCGSDGQVCQAGGVCACQAGSCPDNTPICQLGACVPCTTDTQCQIGSLGDRCCGGVCQECCNGGDCSGTTPICDDGTCVSCSASNPCPSGCCNATTGTCVANCPNCQTCDGGVCIAEPDGTACGTQPGAGTLRCCARNLPQSDLPHGGDGMSW
jgi:hypothetical protein